MGNVKARKTRHLRTGANPNPFPTTEQVLAQVATGVVEGLAQRVIDKAVARISAFGANRRAGARVHVPHPERRTAPATPPNPAAESTVTPPKSKRPTRRGGSNKPKK